MNVSDASNSADDQADNEANNSVDGDGMPDATDTLDADVLEIITQIQTNKFLNLELTVPNPEQFPSAKSESPSEHLANLVEPSSADMEVVEQFPYGKPSVLVNDLQGSSAYKPRQDTLAGSIWEPFQSECNWDFAYWAKTNKLSLLALADLLVIPNVRLFFFFFFMVLLNVVKAYREAWYLIPYCEGPQFNH